MSEDQQQPEDSQANTSAQETSEPEEDELRRQMEEEIRKVRMEDLVLQSAVSLLNLAARRIGKEDERDLEQARIGIDAAEALSAFAPEEARPQMAQAVSELKLVYAKEVDDTAGTKTEAGSTESEESPQETSNQADSGLWTPGDGKS